MAYQPKPGTLFYSNMLNNIETGKTIVDDFLNTRSIRDRAPSAYMSEFGKKKPDHFIATMETHMISLAMKMARSPMTMMRLSSTVSHRSMKN